MNTLAEDVRDDSIEEDDDEDDDNASEMVSEIGKPASKETTRDKDTQDSEASGLTPSNKKTILEDQQEVTRRNKDCQNKKNLKSA